MIRSTAIAVLVFLAACGSKANNSSVCVEQPAPPACSEMCDPSPGIANSCPEGFYCGGNGKCTADCGAGQSCPSGQTCTPDGHCLSNSGGPDADCPAVHFTPMKTTPSVELLLDRSGSMKMSDIAPTRYKALQTALTGAMGAVTSTQASVYYGAALFTGDEDPCPPNAMLDNAAVPRALNNATAINNLITANPPTGSTPTAVWITAIKNDFAANPPPSGSPPIILLATDGQPNDCLGGADNGASVAAVQAAYTAGIRTFIIGLQLGGTDQFLQDIANAGVGKAVNQAPMCTNCAPYYTANNPSQLSAGLQAIIGGVISCDLTISGMVDPSTASQGTVTLNGTTLTYGTDWTVDPNGMVIHLLGQACSTLETSTNPVVDASFPCGVVVQ